MEKIFVVDVLDQAQENILFGGDGIDGFGLGLLSFVFLSEPLFLAFDLLLLDFVVFSDCFFEDLVFVFPFLA